MLVLSYAVGLVDFDPERIVALRRIERRRVQAPGERSATRSHVEVALRRRGRRRPRHRGLRVAGAQPGRQAGAARASSRRSSRRESRRTPRRTTSSSAVPVTAVNLDGKRLLITGVLTHRSIAFAVAEQAQLRRRRGGAHGFGRARRLTERAAKRLPEPADVLELDVNSPDDLRRPARRAATTAGAASTACCTRSPSRPRTRSAGASSRHRPRAPPRPSPPAPSRSRPWPPSCCPCSRTAAASSGSTSTPRSPGRHTTGWASRRPASRRSPATWPATSGPRGVRVNLVSAGPIETPAAGRHPRLRPPGRGVGGPRTARLGHERPSGRGTGRLLPVLRLVARHQRRDPARRRRLPRDGHGDGQPDHRRPARACPGQQRVNRLPTNRGKRTGGRARQNQRLAGKTANTGRTCYDSVSVVARRSAS